MKTRHDIDDIYPQLTRVETTIGTNGYPRGLEWAFYADSRKEMETIIEELESKGHEVEELFIRKRDGHSLWNRDRRNHVFIELDIAEDFDWTMSLDMDDSEEDIKQSIFDSLIGDGEDYIEDIGRKEADRRVNDFYDEVKYLKDRGGITVFYRPDYDNDIDYIITEDCTGYNDGDVTTYQMAFSVYEKENEEL